PVRRRCEDEGIHPRDRPDGQHLVFGDDQTLPPRLAPPGFDQSNGMVADEPVLKRFGVRLETRTSRVTRRDYDHQKARGQLNPLHESLKKLSRKGRSDINRFTVTPERMLARDHLARSQQLLSLCLDNSCYQQALADHLSLDGFEYLAEFYFTSQLLPLLAASPAQLDTLAPSGRIADAVNDRTLYASSETPGQRLINRLADDDNHPLHKMLWPEVNLASLTMPYQKPAEPNASDGRFRPDELAAFENEEAPAGEPTTLNAAVMAGLLKGGSLKNALVASAKAGANALHQIHANLLGAVNAAQAALEQGPGWAW